MIKAADFLGDSVPSRQQQEPWRWTLGALPSGSDTVCALRTQAPGARTVHLPDRRAKPLGVILVHHVYERHG